jgi:hypothetical protein
MKETYGVNAALRGVDLVALLTGSRIDGERRNTSMVATVIASMPLDYHSVNLLFSFYITCFVCLFGFSVSWDV